MNQDHGGIPKVFISYSHDSKDHMDNVLALSNRLRANGVNCIIDQYETSPPEGWAHWSEKQIEDADFVLVVCTDTYQRRFKGMEESRKGLGVKWEGAIITQELYEAEARNNQFIPVLFSPDDASHIPILLRGATRYIPNTDEGYKGLYRHLTNQHATPKPVLGKLLEMPPRERKQDFPEINQTIINNNNITEKMGKTFPYDVFLSHNSKDKQVVRELAQRLKNDGIRVWFDEWEIKPGDIIGLKIEKGLEESKTLILFISKNALSSEWVTLERHTALFRDPTNTQRRFIPLRLDDVEIKDTMKQFLYIDWRQKSDEQYTKLVKACRPDLEEKIEGLKFNIKDKLSDYNPDSAPELVNDFIGRKIEQEEIIASLDKVNMIVIEGKAGIGKTELAAKIQDLIKNDFITHWKDIYLTNFESIINDFANFFYENGDTDLYYYLKTNWKDHTNINNNILRSLNSKKYLIFFENCHHITSICDGRLNDLFLKLKNNMQVSTAVLITRTKLDIINPQDIIDKKVLSINLEGLDPESTFDYFSQKGVTLSSEQLNEIIRKTEGHPLALKLLANVLINEKIENVIKDLPNNVVDLEDYLMNEIFSKLLDDKKEIVEFLCVLRKPIESDDLTQIIGKGNIRPILKILAKELLVTQNTKFFYLHDLLRVFGYNLIDKTKKTEIHKSIGYYYKSLDNKNYENLIETFYHLIRAYENCNDEIIEYFLSIPDNQAYLFFIINEILKENTINSNKIFLLFDKFIASRDSQIVTAFLLSYGYYFDKIYSINKEASFDVYHKILQLYTEIGVLDAVSHSIREIANKYPSESLQIWKKVLNINPQLEGAIVVFINDTNIKLYEYIEFLKYVLEKSHDDNLKQTIKNIFEKWEIPGYQHTTIADHLKVIRDSIGIDSIKYIENNYKLILPHFSVQILSELMKYDKHKVLQLLRNVVEYHKEKTLMLFLVSDILSCSLEREDIHYFNNLFLQKQDDKYSLLVGIRTLDLLSHKFESEPLLEYLNPLLNHENETIRKIVDITKKEIINKNYVGVRKTKKSSFLFKLVCACMKPDRIKDMVKTEMRPTANFPIAVWSWGGIKLIEEYDSDEIIDMGITAFEKSNPVARDAGKWIAYNMQNDPKTFVNFVYKQISVTKLTYKLGWYPLILLMGKLVPEDVDELLKKIIKDEDEAVLQIVSILMLYKNQNTNNREELLKDLLNHKNKDISGFADFLLNGLNQNTSIKYGN